MSGARTLLAGFALLTVASGCTADGSGADGPRPGLSDPTSGLTAIASAPANGVLLGNQPDDSRGARTRARQAFGSLRGGAPQFDAATTSVSFSPDGTRLAYVAADGVRIRTVGTGVEQSLGACEGCQVAWAPTGDRIAVAIGVGLELWTMGSDEVVPLDVQGLVVTSPAWSPDGRTLAFVGTVRDRIDTAALYVVGLGSRAQRLVWRPRRNDALEPGVAAPAWSPDGTRIYFVHEHAMPASPPWTSEWGASLESIRPDGTGRRRLLFLGKCSCDEPGIAWAPDGSRLAVTFLRDYWHPEPNVAARLTPYTITIKPDGSDRQRITPTLVGPLAWQPLPR
jgi:hypothetical protein